MIDKFEQMRKSVYESNKLRGFWEQGQDKNKGEAVALIVSELMEALEAHRKKRFCVLDKFCTDILLGNDFIDEDTWKDIFLANVKDTIEDEIADAAIRILDYCGGFDIKIIDREYRKVSTDNFGHDILRINWYCIKAFHDVPDGAVKVDWGYVLKSIITFCEWYNIDLMKHIEWKIKYNSSRPYKHGKDY